MLVPTHVEVARRLCGQPISWADYARAILKQAHEDFTQYGSRIGTGPWYVVWTPAYNFKMVPICKKNCYHSFRVSPTSDNQYWVFEVIP